MSASFPRCVGRVGEGLFVGPEVDWRGSRLCRCVLLVNVDKRVTTRNDDKLLVLNYGYSCYRRYIIGPVHSPGASDPNTGRTRYMKHRQHIATSPLSVHVAVTSYLSLYSTCHVHNTTYFPCCNVYISATRK